MKPRSAIVYLLFAGTLTVVLPSCSDVSDSGKPRSTGTTCEILVVTDSKETWNGPVGDTIRHWFSQPIPALPQPEPMFDLMNVATADFNKLFNKQHNILIIELDATYTGQAATEIRKDVWSSPQRVITIRAASPDAFYDEFGSGKSSLTAVFHQLERDRIELLNRMSDDPALSRKISDRFNLSINMPGGFNIAKEAPGFMWLRHTVVKQKQDAELGIMIYFSDYTDTAQLNPKSIMTWRNVQTRAHIPGPSDGSFMTISREFIPPVFSNPPDFPAGYAVEMRGLWKVENDFMGGAFVNYTFVDQLRNRVITLDGYVYNPNELKRNFLLQLESILYTTTIIK